MSDIYSNYCCTRSEINYATLVARLVSGTVEKRK